MAGIYLHIPFCKQACNYCNFHFSTLLKNKDAMVQAIMQELHLQQHFFNDKTIIDTIYFGGGTPSLLSIDEINLLLHKINDLFTVDKNAEITLEANPDDLSENYLHQLKTKTAINRLSIGVQSFLEADLKYMHRVHTATEAIACLKNAQRVGFTNLSIDLIYGTPTLSNEQWKKNLQTVFDLHIPHISCYALTVEEKTALAHQIKIKKTIAPDDVKMAEQFYILIDEMQKNEYMHYEISNFSKPNHAAIHNANYWKGLPYLGVGPSAHSFDGIKRYWNIANNTLYIKNIEENNFLPENEMLSTTDLYNEYVMISLRTIDGIDVSYLFNTFGETYYQYFKISITPFIEQQLVKESNENYVLTTKGKLHCDGISSALFFIEEKDK